MHARIFDDKGDLLFSTWEGENGSLEESTPDVGSSAIAWPRGAIPPRHSIWSSFAEEIAQAPRNATLRFEDHVVPSLRQERIELAKDLDLPRFEVLRRDAVDAVMANATPGTRVRFLGSIPIDIVGRDNESVVIHHAIEDATRIPIPRSIGLDVIATPIGGGLIRYRLDAPEGRFTAHQNCQAPQQQLVSGYYVVREESAAVLVLDRYVGAAEVALEGKRVDLELTFFDDIPDREVPFNDMEI